VPLTVTIPHTTESAIGTPTGVVFNGSATDFAITPGNPSLFIFVSLDGAISAWNSGMAAVVKVQGSPNSVLTGATIAQVQDDRFLYVADLKEGRIKVYDTNFTPVEARGAFKDDDIPKGFVRGDCSIQATIPSSSTGFGEFPLVLGSPRRSPQDPPIRFSLQRTLTRGTMASSEH
jgi:hypothetical protein